MGTASLAKEDRLSAKLLRVSEFLRAPLAGVRTNAMVAIFKRTKIIYSDGILSFTYINESDWPGMRAGLRNYAVNRAKLEVLDDWVSNIAGVITVCMVFAVILASVDINYISNIPVEIITGVAASVAALGLAILVLRIVPGGVVFKTVSVFLAAAAILAATLEANDPSFRRPWHVLPRDGGILASALTGGAVIAAIVMVVVLGSFTILFLVDLGFITGPIVKRRPDILVTITLIRLLGDLQKSPLSFDNVRTKADICADLERIARYLQDRLPAVLGLSDLSAKKDLQENCDNGSAHLRHLQVKVALADNSTLNDLRAALAHYVAIFVLGKYGLLPTEVATTIEQGRRSKVAKISKTLIVAVIPIGCLIAVRYAGIKLSGPFNNWAIAIALIWAAVSLVSIIDPSYRTRIEDMSNIASIFRRNDN